MASMTITGSFPSNDYNDGLFIDVHVLKGAAKAVNQTGAIYVTPASSADQGFASITTTTVNSVVYGVFGDPAESEVNAVPYGNGTNAILANSTTLTGGSSASFGFVTFDSLATTTPGAQTMGVQDSSGTWNYAAGSIALVEILAANGSMISLDGSGPSPSQADTFTGPTSTSAAFTPALGSLLLVLLAYDANGGHTSADFTISDTAGLTWHLLAFANGNGGEAVAIYVADVPPAPTSGLLAALFP